MTSTSRRISTWSQAVIASIIGGSSHVRPHSALSFTRPVNYHRGIPETLAGETSLEIEDSLKTSHAGEYEIATTPLPAEERAKRIISKHPSRLDMIESNQEDSHTQGSKHPPARRLWLFRLAVLSTVTLLLLVAGELLLRASNLVYVGLTHAPSIYLPDKELGYRHRPNAEGWFHRNFEMDCNIRINSAGWHDVERDKAPARGLRILAIGDSFTAALQVPIRQSWTQIAEEELRKRRDDSSVVINLGIDATGTDVHLTVLQQNVEEYDPDIVILSFCDNDIGDVTGRALIYRSCFQGFALQYQDEDQKRLMETLVTEHLRDRRFERWLFERAYLFRLLAWGLEGPRNLLRRNIVFPTLVGRSWLPPDHAVGQKDLDRIFDSFLRLAAKHQFELMIIPLPCKESETRALEILRETLSAGQFEKLPLFDIGDSIRERLEAQRTAYGEMFWRYDIHFNELGNRLYGLAIADMVSKPVKEPSLSDREPHS